MMKPSTAVCQGDDPTEAFRRRRLAQLNPGVGRAELEQRHGTVLDSEELADSFKVIGFMAPIAVVKRKTDGKIGTLELSMHRGSISTGKKTTDGTEQQKGFAAGASGF